MVRVADGFLYGLIIGAAFLRKHGGVIRFAAGGGLKPAPESPWVPFIMSSVVGLSRTVGRKAAGWRAAAAAATLHDAEADTAR